MTTASVPYDGATDKRFYLSVAGAGVGIWHPIDIIMIAVRTFHDAQGRALA